MQPLYRLADCHLDLLDQLVDGEVPPDLEPLLDASVANIDEKAAGIVKALRNLAATEDMLKIEIDRLQQRRKKIQERHEWLKDYLLRNMERLGLQRAGLPAFYATVQQSQPKVVLSEAAEKATSWDEFHELGLTHFVVESLELSKRSMLDAYKEGTPLPPSVSVVRGKHLRIS